MIPLAALFKLPEKVTDVSFVMIALSWLVFGLAFFLISRWVWKPIVNALAKREYDVREKLLKAHEAEEALAKAEADKAKLLQDAHAQAQRVTQQGVELGRKTQAEIEKQARADADALLQSAQDQVARERQQLQAQMRDQAVNLATDMAQKLLASQFTADDANTFTNLMIDKIKTAKA